MSDITEQNTSSEKLPSVTGDDFLAAVDGIPLPPAVKKNLWNALSRLVTGLVDVPAAWLDAQAQKRRIQSAGLTHVTKSAAEAAAEQFKTDPELIERSVKHFGSRLLGEQLNREKVVHKAIEDLKADPPKEDVKEEIDPDWLEMFSRVAETKSNEDVQLFLSRILAGEIRKPGSFSPRTIHVLSTLDQRTAHMFQALCNISFEICLSNQSPVAFVLCEPMGDPGNSELAPVGLNYTTLSHLQDAGLIQGSLEITRGVVPDLFRYPHTIGSAKYRFETGTESLAEKTSTNTLSFTQVGLELRRVIHLSSHPIYNQKYVEWVVNKFKLILIGVV